MFNINESPFLCKLDSIMDLYLTTKPSLIIYIMYEWEFVKQFSSLKNFIENFFLEVEFQPTTFVLENCSLLSYQNIN